MLLTAAIDYLTGPPHVGHLFEKILADALARTRRLAGEDVFLVLGTDEHGERIVRLAAEAGLSPQAYADRLAHEAFRGLWDRAGLAYSAFVRTTDPGHVRYVQAVLQRAYDAGDIYHAEYEGLYSLGSERFVTEKELVVGEDGIARVPGDKDPPEPRREANYFLKMERHRPWLREYLETHPELIAPAAFRNEILEMLREPIDDLSISRPRERLSWGVPIPWDTQHVTYVWFDALLGYLSAPLQAGAGEEQELAAGAWHVIGKDILKPHALFWPIIRRAAGLPVYEKLVVHSHILAEDGRKMGKSLGNAIDPEEMLRDYPIDSLRYALLREASLGSDTPFGTGILRQRHNSELAGALGNLLARTVAMVRKYRAGRIPAPGPLGERERAIEAAARALPGEVLRFTHEARLNRALEASMAFVRDLNRYIAESEPWALAKDEANAQALNTVLYTAAEGLRVASVALEAVLPQTMPELRRQLGLQGTGGEYPLAQAWGLLPPGSAVQAGAVLFPRLEEPEKETPNPPKATPKKKKATMSDENTQATAPATAPATEGSAPAQPPTEGAPAQAGSEEITIDDFARIDLRVAEVLAAEAVPKTDKLLKLTVRLGEEERTVVSGIRQWFAPEDLVGRRVVVVANLKPVKLRGIMSHGMVLAAEDDSGNLDLVGPRLELPGGTKVR